MRRWDERGHEGFQEEGEAMMKETIRETEEDEEKEAAEEKDKEEKKEKKEKKENKEKSRRSGWDRWKEREETQVVTQRRTNAFSSPAYYIGTLQNIPAHCYRTRTISCLERK
jgi:hypothetical protein